MFRQKMIYIKNLLFLSIVLSLILSECAFGKSKPGAQLIFSSISYVSKTEFMNASGKVVNSKLNMDWYVFKDFKKDLHCTIELLKKLSNSPNSDYKSLDKQTIDLCKLFSGKQKNFFMKTLFSNIEKFGNITHLCPIDKGYYYLRDYTADGQAAVPILSLFAGGEYQLIFTIFETPPNVKRNNLLMSTANIQIK